MILVGVEQVKYACDRKSFICNRSSSGNYSNVVSCEKNCTAPPPPPKKFNCDSKTHKCVESTEGKYPTLDHCNAECVKAHPSCPGDWGNRTVLYAGTDPNLWTSALESKGKHGVCALCLPTSMKKDVGVVTVAASMFASVSTSRSSRSRSRLWAKLKILGDIQLDNISVRDQTSSSRTTPGASVAEVHGKLSATAVLFSHNSGAGYVHYTAGIYVYDSGIAEFSACTFEYNSGPNGAITTYGTTSVKNCFFEHNTGLQEDGGAIWVNSRKKSPLTVTNSTFVDNRGGNCGMAIYICSEVAWKCVSPGRQSAFGCCYDNGKIESIHS
jgi:hypothetical protein